MRRLGLALGVVPLLLGTACAAAAPHPAQAAFAEASDPMLAGPVVSGAAGPFARATVTLRRKSGEIGAPFDGVLDAGGGRTLALVGPDEPADFFLLDVRAVLFAPVDRSRSNGVVVLYNSSQIGPGHGTDRRALVYRVTAQAATRVPALEAKLAGARTAAEARARLRKAVGA